MFVLLLAEWQLSAKANDNFIYWERRALIPHKQFSIILVTNEKIFKNEGGLTFKNYDVSKKNSNGLKKYLKGKIKTKY